MGKVIRSRHVNTFLFASDTLWFREAKSWATPQKPMYVRIAQWLIGICSGGTKAFVNMWCGLWRDDDG